MLAEAERGLLARRGRGMRDGERAQLVAAVHLASRARPIERISSLTRCEPALVDPPSQTSSAFADALSECVSIE